MILFYLHQRTAEIGRIALSRLGLTVCIGLAALAVPSAGAMAEDQKVTGIIRGFECGDNCYLTIVDAENAEQIGLCVAPECQDWLAEAAMPESYIGKRVQVTLGIGQQLDGSDNVMGEMMSFTRIDFLD